MRIKSNVFTTLSISLFVCLMLGASNALACREINVSTSDALVNALVNTRVCDRIEVAAGTYDVSALSYYDPVTLADRVRISGEGTADTTVLNLPIQIQANKLKLADITISNFFRQDVAFVGSQSKFKSVHFRGNYSGIWGSRWRIEGDNNSVLGSEVSDMKLMVTGNKNIIRRTVIHPWLDRSGTLIPLILTGDGNLVKNSTLVANAPIARGLYIVGSKNRIINTIIQSVSSTNQGNAVYVQSGTRNKIDYSLIDFAGESEIAAAPGAQIIVGAGIVRGNPMFVDPDGGDFHLLAGSPAIDAGDPNQLDPDGTRSDIGAFYYPQ